MFEVENGISNIVHVTSLGESYDHDDKFILVTSSYIHIPTEIFLYITVILICTVSRHIARKSFSLQFSALQEILSQLQFWKRRGQHLWIFVIYLNILDSTFLLQEFMPYAHINWVGGSLSTLWKIPTGSITSLPHAYSKNFALIWKIINIGRACLYPLQDIWEVQDTFVPFSQNWESKNFFRDCLFPSTNKTIDERKHCEVCIRQLY